PIPETKHWRNPSHTRTNQLAMTPQPDTTQSPFPNYLLAEDDTAFLKRPELRPVRVQLELLKPEILLTEHNISSTLVVFGGTQIVERPEAERRLAEAKANLAADPTSRVQQRAVARAERVWAKTHCY